MERPLDWDSEFDKLVESLRSSFRGNKIQDFLVLSTRLNSLFTTKLQFVIDKKDKTTQEINFNVDPKVLDKIDLFNKNFSDMASFHEETKTGLKNPGANATLQSEIKDNKTEEPK